MQNETTKCHYDLAIVGAGPAGMSAAASAAAQGLKVALFDEQPTPGGQIYRSISLPALADRTILGADYYRGEQLLSQFQQAEVDYYASATVWQINNSFSLCVSLAGRSQIFTAERILLATGAQERPVPFPGWTLPGVMTCGAAQILLKSSGLTPPAPLVLAGSGPLLLLIACQLHKAGVEIHAILDTTPTANYSAAFKHLPGALRSWRNLWKGVKMLAYLKRSSVPFYSNVSQLKAQADTSTGSLSDVQFQQGDKAQQLSCQSLLVHQGVITNVQLSQSLGLKHQWHNDQLCWQPQLNDWGESSQQGLFIAGDSAAIGGALAAEYAGHISALQIAMQLGKISAAQRNHLSQAAQQQRTEQLAIRPFLDALYKPRQDFLRPSDDTLVCRCEEVSAGQIRQLARQGCAGPNQTKAFVRAGMGPCQGRMCGNTVSELIAEVQQQPVAQVGHYNVRAPIKPITLAEMASMADDE